MKLLNTVIILDTKFSLQQAWVACDKLGYGINTWLRDPSSVQVHGNIKNSGVTFPRAATMRVSRFTVGLASGFPQNLSRHARSRGAAGIFPWTRAWHAARNAETTFTSLRYYMQWRCLASGAKSKREVRVGNGHACAPRLGVARGSKTKRMYSESRRFLIVHKGRVDCPDNRGTDTRLVYT